MSDDGDVAEDGFVPVSFSGARPGSSGAGYDVLVRDRPAGFATASATDVSG
jgi:hypothetical protein